jgi:hypothetical protein
MMCETYLSLAVITGGIHALAYAPTTATIISVISLTKTHFPSGMDGNPANFEIEAAGEDMLF